MQVHFTVSIMMAKMAGPLYSERNTDMHNDSTVSRNVRVTASQTASLIAVSVFVM